MTAAIAWIDGCWGPNDQLKIPLSDRGLQLADGLFETILIDAGEPQLLAPHLARVACAARSKIRNHVRSFAFAHCT